MIILSSISQLLQLITSSSAGIHFDLSFVDMAENTHTPLSVSGSITSATTSVILDEPAADITRILKHATFRNIHASTSNSITVVKVVDSDSFKISATVPLAAGEVLEYVDTVGWQRIGATGMVMFVGETGADGAPGSGGGGIDVVVVPDADIVAEAGKGYLIGATVLTGDTNFDVSGITNEGEAFEIYNMDITHNISFTGGDVYLMDRVTTEPTLRGQIIYQIRLIGGLLTIIN